VHIALRWELQKGIVTIPKSVHKERIISNSDIFDFELDNIDIAKIDALDRDQHFGSHPDTFTF
jgi:diketogulonate reductase-like aldo/keto reductase